ncbi:hypothetical protein [Pseudomonas sp. TH10]|uniref:hypothetical protein n=1 Tax=Pseudomonas sp. TH10 TaxID=2796376 RepID=UPI0035A86995
MPWTGAKPCSTGCARTWQSRVRRPWRWRACMASLIEVRRLLRFSDHRQQRCELALSSARRRLSPLELELGAIDRQAEGFRELMLSNRMEAQTVSHLAAVRPIAASGGDPPPDRQPRPGAGPGAGAPWRDSGATG